MKALLGSFLIHLLLGGEAKLLGDVLTSALPIIRPDLLAAINIQTATRAEKSSKVAQKTLSNESFLCCDPFLQIFVSIGAVLAIFRPFEIFHAL